jgi:hypothetical protein
MTRAFLVALVVEPLDRGLVSCDGIAIERDQVPDELADVRFGADYRDDA